MAEMKIRGGEKLRGRIAISGAKNGALPLLFASIVAGGPCTFYRVPDIGDVRLAAELLVRMGAEVKWLEKNVLYIDAREASPEGIDPAITTHLRASSYLLGACLGRFGMCPALTTGGCDFGARPLDRHYAFFHALGAEGEGELSSPAGLHGTAHHFPDVSVGATINALLAASRIPEETYLTGCATEAHVGDLVRFLVSIGVDIDGLGTPTLRIRGSRSLRGGTYAVSSDDIEAGTYLLATAACGGDITLANVNLTALRTPIAVLRSMGCLVTCGVTELRLVRTAPLGSATVVTAPSPGFPTDLHPPLVAAMLGARERGFVRESVWQGRFRYTEELVRMGADLSVEGDTVIVRPSRLHPAAVTATDLRGGAALVIAALATEGYSTVAAREILERGYEDMPRKLRSLGAWVY